MKHIIILYDGMADEPLPALGGKTPMEVARKPRFDVMGRDGEVGLVHTTPPGQSAGSDNTNLNILGYDSTKYYTGRSPIEAVSIGVPMEADDLCLRCNLVTLSDEDDYAAKTMVDYAGSEITTEQAREVIAKLQAQLGSDEFQFFAGVQYRHCLLWKGGRTKLAGMRNTPPHDIIGQPIVTHMPSHPELLDLMQRSTAILNGNKANAIWLWGEGTCPALPSFEHMTGLRGSIISAVDLLKGIGMLADMRTPTVPGATDWIDTNYAGEAQAAVDEFKAGQDFVFLHFEATDEAGHRGDVASKIRGIELIDEIVLPIVLDYLEQQDDYALMILPDHPTPLARKTHTKDPVPYMMFRKSWRGSNRGVDCVSEKTAAATGNVLAHAPDLIRKFIVK
ncbi:MAG: cofactor-independent phosphoglycerate mutase [Oscillospiraceae bacterium]|nr:cofactor-independent phosphoglycerate mutase [Oscillospiraceae bacterium]